MKCSARFASRVRGILAVAAITVVLSASAAKPQPALYNEGPLPDLGGAVGWLNTAPLNSRSLRGKVVLVDIWTYSCINSLRQLPYLKSWAAKYKAAGLVVIGVHAPEFGFEKERENVERAVHDYKITYPVAIDTDHEIWEAFNNEYWPADYIIDAKGRIRYHHFGEGEYATSEHVIQELLKENGATGLDASTVNPSADGIEAAPGNDGRSPETYVGYRRTTDFASPERLARRAQDLHPTRQSFSESMGTGRLMERRRRECHASGSFGQDSLSLPQPRLASGVGSGERRQADSL